MPDPAPKPDLLEDGAYEVIRARFDQHAEPPDLT